MTLQVLVASMFQNDYSLISRMNIKTSAIVGNQCDRNEVQSFDVDGKKVTYLSFCERGVGLNRNNCLMRATADYCLFADDDMVYYDNYEKIVVDSFEEHPDADVIVFNITENTGRYVNKRDFRISYFNFMRYGAARIAIKTQRIQEANVFFNLCFGGGTQHGHGEDVLFLAECLKKNLKIYASPKFIAELRDTRESTWFRGYDDKFFQDHGALFYAINSKIWKLLCFQDALRHHNQYGCSMIAAYSKMIAKRK